MRITGMGTVDRSTRTSIPASWRPWTPPTPTSAPTARSTSTLPGATPAKLLVAVSKDGHMYLLDSDNLGGMGGADGRLHGRERRDGRFTPRRPPTRRPTGVHVAFATDIGRACARRGGQRQGRHVGADPAGRAAHAAGGLVRAARRATVHRRRSRPPPTARTTRSSGS